jgi:hypothetical protein
VRWHGGAWAARAQAAAWNVMAAAPGLRRGAVQDGVVSGGATGGDLTAAGGCTWEADSGGAGAAQECSCARASQGAGDGGTVVDGDSGGERAADGGARTAEWRAKSKGRRKNESEQTVVSRQERYMTCGPRRFSYRRLIRRLGFEHRLIASV